MNEVVDKFKSVEFTAPLPIHVIRGRSGVLNLNKDYSRRFLVIEDCHDLLISVHVKVVKMLFINCHRLQIYLYKPSFGPLECFRCSDIYINSLTELPFIYLESVEQCRIRQMVESLSYVIDLCDAISIKHAAHEYSVPINLFDPRNLIHVDGDGMRQYTLPRWGFKNILI
jgi:hypothetical protein